MIGISQDTQNYCITPPCYYNYDRNNNLLFLGVCMKKMLSIVTVLSAALAFGVVYEDPNATPEQREAARKTNESIRQRNREREAEKQRQLDTLSQKYKDVVENVKKRHKENPAFQEALAMAELEAIARYDPEVQKYLDEVNAVREKYRMIVG
jgi:hypothetical protein